MYLYITLAAAISGDRRNLLGTPIRCVCISVNLFRAGILEV